MSISDIQQKILDDADFVLSEVDRLQYLYRLKEEIRYDGIRDEEIRSESVAEHVYAMYLLANYFIKLEDLDKQWNHSRIYNMILWHDMDEIVTGDIIGYLKTDADRAREREATKELVAGLSPVIQADASSYLREYEDRESIEARFVKAIDKLEPSIHSFNENGKQTFIKNGTTLEQHERIKDPFMQDFMYINRFNRVITDEMVEQGFFVSAA